ncbi:hypothetical protein [Nocardiopsis sp. CC223A]|uniref:hypothetical protein n=1 Tax=Nocardiopsis sp. CC223A TaxID=3044051 RepID=UPI00278BFD3E|nr:hypothetical protein [Nocardiopsis sp. CC223A]
MTEPPRPFGERLSAARTLADLAGADTALLDELSDIAAHAEREQVRVAVAMGPVPERIRLLNALVGRPILPRGRGADLPVLVHPADRDTWEARTGRGWTRLEAAPGPDPEITAVRAGTPALADRGLEFLLVPEGDQAAHAADAVLLTLTATAAFTLTERSLLEGLFDRGLAPGHVLIVLVHTELVDEEERDEVVRYVRERAHEMSPDLGVAVVPAGDGSAPLPEDVRAWLAYAADGPGAARDHHVAHRLAACLTRIGERAAAGEREAAADRALRAREAAAARHVHEDRLREFDLLREDVRARRNAVYTRLREDRDRTRDTLAAALRYELGNSTNPQRWWTRDLPHRIGQRLTLWNEQIRLKLQPVAAQDITAVDAALSESFGLHLRVPDPPASGFARVEVPVPDDRDLTDLGRRRVVYRVAPSGAALAAALLLPGFGPVLALTASVVGTTLGEVRLRSLAQEQRDTVGERLPVLVDAEIDACADAVRDELDRLYGYLEDEVTRSREEWHRGDGPSVPAIEPGPDWTAIADRVRELTAEVLAEAGPVQTRGAGR